MRAAHFFLPDLFATCPLEGTTNPHHQTAGQESREWLESYDMFSNHKKAFIVAGQNELLVSFAYPFAGYDQFRTVCDFVNLLFVVDEISDDQNGEDARETGNVFLNAMKYPDWDDGSPLARMTKDFRARFYRHAGANSARRFLKHCEDYIAAVAREASLREKNKVLGIQDYIALRRENSAIRLCFGLFEMCLGVDLPQEVFEDPAFMKVYFAAADHVCWANDVYSYAMELSKGCDGNNIVTVLMKAKRISLQEASDFIGIYAAILMNQFTQVRELLPSFGKEVDEAVDKYLDAAGNWVRGNLDWSFESQRYFGADHGQIQRTRLVKLQYPVQDMDDSDKDSGLESD